MKTIHFALSASIAALCAQPHGTREFRVSAIGQLQAKSGTITAGGGSDAALEAAVAQSDPKVATLGQVVADALAESEQPKIVTVCTANRKVRVLNAAVNQATLNTAAETGAMGRTDTLTRDDDTKVSVPYSDAPDLNDTPLEGAITAMVGPQKPAIGIASLVNQIADAAAELGSELVIVVDQVSDEVRVFSDTQAGGGAAAAADAAIAAAFAEEAVFTQTITSSGAGPRPLGE